MSIFTDATMAELPVILQCAEFMHSPAPFLLSFIQGSSDAALIEYLQNVRNRIKDTEAVPASLAQLAIDVERSADALQGIEDQEQTAVSCQTSEDDVNLVVSIGGATIELP